MKLNKFERETIISFNEAEATATIYTHNAALVNKLEKIRQNNPLIIEVAQDEHSRTYNLPKAWIKVRPPRNISDEQRDRMRETVPNRLNTV